MSTLYKFSSHAKVILAGEHAVLRGSPAIVLPLQHKIFTLSYLPDQRKKYLKLECYNSEEDTIINCFWSALNKALEIVSKSEPDVAGTVFLENDIHIGTGMGFSSALCVSIASWFVWKRWIKPQHIFQFSKNLENIFHGKSSGVDIVGAMKNKIMLYKINYLPIEIISNWQPKLLLTFSKQQSITSECVKKVQALWQSNTTLGKELDKKMQDSVVLAKKALEAPPNLGLLLLRQAINEAEQCFSSWQLISPEMQQHLKKLKEAGAIAAKPTGAGLGGYALSLWKEDPSPEIINKLNPIICKFPFSR